RAAVTLRSTFTPSMRSEEGMRSAASLTVTSSRSRAPQRWRSVARLFQRRFESPKRCSVSSILRRRLTSGRRPSRLESVCGCVTWVGLRFTETTASRCSARAAAARSRQKRVKTSWRCSVSQWGSTCSGPRTVPSRRRQRTNASAQKGSLASKPTIGWYWKPSSCNGGMLLSSGTLRLSAGFLGRDGVGREDRVRGVLRPFRSRCEPLRAPPGDQRAVVSRVRLSGPCGSAGVPFAALAEAVGHDGVGREGVADLNGAEGEAEDGEADGEHTSELVEHEYLLRWVKATTGGASNPLQPDEAGGRLPEGPMKRACT